MSAIHANAREFDAKAEGFFRYVQVFTAIVDSYSHGANDVSNAMGPFSAVYLAWKKGAVVSKAELSDGTNFWILAIGGAGIVVGLATYGYKIMNARRGVVDASLETRHRGTVSTPDPRRPWASS